MSYGGAKPEATQSERCIGRVLCALHHGDNYASSIIDRLNMQRHFYAGLFGVPAPWALPIS